MVENKRKIVVTSALPYANGDIHLGHLVEYAQTDFWVRFQKMRGHDCIYVCADDTHGTPVMMRARSEGITPEELMQKVFVPGYRLKTRQDLVEEQFERFVGASVVDGSHFNVAKQLFSSYLLFDDIRGIMHDPKRLGSLATEMRLSMQDLTKLGRTGIDATLNYIKDNVPLNRFLPR